MKQTELAKKSGCTDGYISQVVSRLRIPNWKRAKQFARITGTDPVLWLEGSSEQIKSALHGGTDNRLKERQRSTSGNSGSGKRTGINHKKED